MLSCLSASGRVTRPWKQSRIFFPLRLWTLVDAASHLLQQRSGLTQRHLVLCVVVTGFVFVAIKTTALGAEAFRVVWTTLQWPARDVSFRSLGQRKHSSTSSGNA